MAIIPSSTRFVGISPSVNLTEKKSNQLNSETQPYTMQDIIDTASSPPAGTAGQIQFSDGSAFAADSNLFWDNTNKRLGVGTGTPTARLHVQRVQSTDGIYLQTGTTGVFLQSDNGGGSSLWVKQSGVGIGSAGGLTAAAQLHIKGSGSTSATTSLLVQDSNGNQKLKVEDGGVIRFSSQAYIDPNYPRLHLGLGTSSNALISTDRNILSFGISSNSAVLTINPTVSGAYISASQTYLGSQSATIWGDLTDTNTYFGCYRPQSSGYFASNRHKMIGWDYVSDGNAGTRLYYTDSSAAYEGLLLSSTGNVGIGTSTPDTSAKVDITSTTQGFLPPRMTTAEKLAIATPAAGLIVYDTSLNQMSYYNGSAWVNF